MNDSGEIIKDLLNNIKKGSENAENEIKKHTLHFLKNYESNKLLQLIKNATLRGYSGVEWIDFWGVGGMDTKIIVKWAYYIIKKQKLDNIIEPYYNNVNQRLGISIKRECFNEKPHLLFLPLEFKN